MIALGNSNAKIKVYIENQPPLEPYQSLNYCLPLEKNDIATIAKETGNHWRKIFNVYAKLIFELSPQSYESWQQLRDLSLLQKSSDQCLVFSAPLLQQKPNELTIIMGKGYAAKLGVAEKCDWLTPYFAINKSLNIIICPYFDYRQLNNQKITQLATLIKQLS
ncbi:DUF6942 family protein [Thalassotalea profundi]|uniref:Uncharacterized protein n=1 Tax=Thalassotalea profundi TaxID=2036687 RepID=A0ABQ3IJ82_9GAMM|nr:hypothetical protein [Thalassotalea profundi]GHE84396.1 hypothetical protein GCM10011501_11360 [Thalassotalea profundi]